MILALYNNMITSNEYKHNEYSDIVQNEVGPDSLFMWHSSRVPRPDKWRYS